MARCEDWPCCGHEAGCCPDYGKFGHQLNMRCTCGAVLPISNRFSICDSCLNRGNDDFGPEPEYNAPECPECGGELNDENRCSECDYECDGDSDYYVREDFGWFGYEGTIEA